jgi:CRISPR-associated endonuclease/helicase Cas3
MNFIELFTKLTGNPPFPWQEALYDRFASDRPDNIPQSCNLPTGLGKTSVIAIWLIALANGKSVPRRLVYVVNRRTVVDQTTNEVEKYRDAKVPGIPEFAISTLRGQFADNREWSADPSRPAVICGTVDMIGSRLLFSGYGIGFKQKPLHAGFLGQDALLVHDEAHLEPAFQTLITAIAKEQERCNEFRRFHVMELTATSRSGGESFVLTPKDYDEPLVVQRIQAKKKLTLIPADDPKNPADQLAKLALERSGAVLVFVRRVEDVDKIVKKLPKDRVEQLTGTLRGLERDGLVRKPIFQRFLPESNRDKDIPVIEGTVFLVCTSAGEVGVNISADHLVSDLSTFDSMAQRFGRVNRFGLRDDTQIEVVHPTDFDDDDPIESRLHKTLDLLEKLNGDASPDALGKLDAKEREAAFAPPPTILPTSDILFDSWALTTIRGKLPGRPPVEPYLHGITPWEPPETHVAWREDVQKLTLTYATEEERREPEANDRRRLAKRIPEWLDDYPLKPHELLRDNSKRVFDRLSKLNATTVPVWVIDDENAATVTTLGELVEKGREEIEGRTVLLPPQAGGLAGGMLTTDDYDETRSDYDVADELFSAAGDRLRLRVDDPLDPRVENMRLIRAVELPSESEDDQDGPELWHWFEWPVEGGSTSKWPVLWHIHVGDVEREAKRILGGLPLDASLKTVVEIAAKYHDHGKLRRNFQLVLGNRGYPELKLAKSGKKGGKLPEKYRHEFGSLIDIRSAQDFVALGADERELVLHLIATHHGRARPHFPQDEAFDHEHPVNAAAEIACEVPRRYARLQRKYGRWGLAYLESLLRAADWAASGSPSEFWKGGV